MKIKKGFAKREIAGSNIVVPIGNQAIAFNGMITLNESGSFFWDCLIEDTTFDEVVAKILAEYDAPEDKVKADLEAFLQLLRTNKILED